MKSGFFSSILYLSLFLFFYQWDKLKAYAEENNIKIIEKLDSWSDAIRVSGELLIKQNYVTKDYIQEMQYQQMRKEEFVLMIGKCVPMYRKK